MYCSKKIFSVAAVGAFFGLLLAFNNCSPSGFESSSQQAQETAADPSPDEPGSTGKTVCPSDYQPPLDTTIIKIGDKDNATRNGTNFDIAFDSSGVRVDTNSDVGQVKAWEFTNDKWKTGRIGGVGNTLGPSNLMVWSVSACPGDFDKPVNSRCFVSGTGVNINYSTDPTDSSKCFVPPNTKLYLNVKAYDPSLGLGYSITNTPIEMLP